MAISAGSNEMGGRTGGACFTASSSTQGPVVRCPELPSAVKDLVGAIQLTDYVTPLRSAQIWQSAAQAGGTSAWFTRSQTGQRKRNGTARKASPSRGEAGS